MDIQRDNFVIRDSRPLASDSHRVEMRRGWDSVAHLSVQKLGSRWYVHSVNTNPEFEGRGLARRLVSYVEENYGPVVVKSANDPFWSKMGFVPADDGYWVKAPPLIVR